jgi:hypothetical protein
MHVLDNFMLPRDKYISAKNKDCTGDLVAAQSSA